MDVAQHLVKQSRQRITTGRLNHAIRTVLEERTPSTHSGRRPRIYYATQIETSPPTIVLVVNNPAYLDEPYQRFMINRLRDLLPYPEVPIRLVIRPHIQKEAAKPGQTEASVDAEAQEPSRPKARRKGVHRGTSRSRTRQ